MRRMSFSDNVKKNKSKEKKGGGGGLIMCGLGRPSLTAPWGIKTSTTRSHMYVKEEARGFMLT